MVNVQRGIPYVLTEHGIYTKERKIDLAQATWINDHNEDVSSTLHEEMGYIRGLWIRFFEQIGKMAYARANPIVSLYEGNRERQIVDGALRERTQVITNGINLDRYAQAMQKRQDGIPLVLGLIGRVVPIKDIKTYIRTLRVLRDKLPTVEGWIIGPEDEDPAYVQECRDLVHSLGLNDTVKFLGFQNVAEILPQLGLLVLTSISEAMPLVLLEGFASGVPCLATDVGSSRELIEGSGEADEQLGKAGAVVSISDPEATAQAAYELLTDSARWQAAQQAGLARVKQYYDDKMMFAAYRELYAQTLNASDQLVADN
jgi:glycosyltransferase involved in cell wall biosynthesis